MADTPRTVTDLTTNLFQDGQAAGAITPQDVRDLIVSFQAEQGMIYVSTPATTTIAVAGTYVKAAGTTTLSTAVTANKYDMPADNRLRYTGTPTRTVKVDVHAAIEVVTPIIDKQIGLQIFKNGSLVTGTTMSTFDGATALTPTMVSTTALVSLATNDYVEAWVTNIDSTDNVTVQQMVITAFSLVS